MKSLLNKIFLFVLLFLNASIGHAQNKTIDSQYDPESPNYTQTAF